MPGLGGEGILPYKSKFYPYGQLIAMLTLGLIIILQVIPLMSSEHHGVFDFIITYASIWVFMLFYFVNKHVAKKKLIS